MGQRGRKMTSETVNGKVRRSDTLKGL